jgi:penicillin-insensitive murein endopeptidase
MVLDGRAPGIDLPAMVRWSNRLAAMVAGVLVVSAVVAAEPPLPLPAPEVGAATPAEAAAAPPAGPALPVAATPPADTGTAKTTTASAGRSFSASTPAREVFGSIATPLAGPVRVIGFYSRGCLGGAAGLPADGPGWQVMRPSRNRAWGTPALVSYIRKLAAAAPGLGWRGLLVGDMSQPRGGPMAFGHASHQIGLDVDIWLTPMPARKLSPAERDGMEPVSMLGPDKQSVDKSRWTPAHLRLLRQAAADPRVERIFVHPAIKKALCEGAGGSRGWLAKVRPYWGHYEHFHVRLSCPPGMASCRAQKPPGGGDGCGKELSDWLAEIAKPPKPPGPPPKIPPLSWLPPACTAIAEAP